MASQTKNMTYDLAVIGGGPAGLMAAGRAAELGAKVIVVEKNKNLGVKLLTTGGGRCNLTNKIDDHKTLAAKYGANGKFLLSGFNKFDVKNTIDFFEKRGVKTKIETNGRVFPVSNQALDILNVLINYLKKSQVQVMTGVEVKKIIATENRIEKILFSTNEEIISKNYLIATGGKSYPLSGSTGTAYGWLKGLGHTIITTYPALSPIILKETLVKNLEGVSFKNIRVTAYQNNKKIAEEIGDLIFTDNGASGPAIINLSRIITDKLTDIIYLKFDFKPEITTTELENNFIAAWTSQNKSIKNSLTEIMPPKFAIALLRSAKIDLDKKSNSITRQERKDIINLIKNWKFTVKGLAGYNKADITKGGVKLSEVDQKTMRSKIINNLYLAGEILDLDGPSGGFNLQICWTTGYIAGENSI